MGGFSPWYSELGCGIVLQQPEAVGALGVLVVVAQVAVETAKFESSLSCFSFKSCKQAWRGVSCENPGVNLHRPTSSVWMARKCTPPPA